MGVNRSIDWTVNASKELSKIHAHLSGHWNSAVAERFLGQILRFEQILTRFPLAFISDEERKGYHRGLIHPHVTAIYRIFEEKISIVTLIDNRADNTKE